MTREAWLKAALEMEPHLKELERIAGRNGMDYVSVSVYGGEGGRAAYTDDDESWQTVDYFRKPGRTEVTYDEKTIYTKS